MVVALLLLYLSLILLLDSIKRIFLSNVFAYARIVLVGLQTFLTLKTGTLKGFYYYRDKVVLGNIRSFL